LHGNNLQPLLSALCQKQTYAPQQNRNLLDCLVGTSDQVSAMNHRALAILHWSERLVGRDGGKQLIIIAWLVLIRVRTQILFRR
jgi:hypothetical protein